MNDDNLKKFIQSDRSEKNLRKQEWSSLQAAIDLEKKEKGHLRLWASSAIVSLSVFFFLISGNYSNKAYELSDIEVEILSEYVNDLESIETSESLSYFEL